MMDTITDKDLKEEEMTLKIEGINKYTRRDQDTS